MMEKLENDMALHEAAGGKITETEWFREPLEAMEQWLLTEWKHPTEDSIRQIFENACPGEKLKDGSLRYLRGELQRVMRWHRIRAISRASKTAEQLCEAFCVIRQILHDHPRLDAYRVSGTDATGRYTLFLGEGRHPICELAYSPDEKTLTLYPIPGRRNCRRVTTVPFKTPAKTVVFRRWWMADW